MVEQPKGLRLRGRTSQNGLEPQFNLKIIYAMSKIQYVNHMFLIQHLNLQRNDAELITASGVGHQHDQCSVS